MDRHSCETSQKCYENLKIFLKKYDKNRVFILSFIDNILQIKFSHTSFKQATLVIVFNRDYPQNSVSVQLKGKYMSENFLVGFSNLCQNNLVESKTCPLEHAVGFCDTFLEEHHLCVCSQELSYLKKNVLRPSDTVKLRQTKSEIHLTLIEARYSLCVAIKVPQDYPDNCVNVRLLKSNFPEVLETYMVAQSQIVSLKACHPDDGSAMVPSFQPAVEFLVSRVRQFVTEPCGLCDEITVLHQDPTNSRHLPPTDPRSVYKLPCDNVFHARCLYRYMTKPPFTEGYKPCSKCQQLICEDKWKRTWEKTEKSRMAQEAKEQEYKDILDLFS